MLYGEGWIMETCEKETKLANFDNSELMENIGFFNDEFRDVIKGNSFDLCATSYGSGNLWL